MAKKTLYVHVGASKAGSSTIRAFLGANAARFRDFGLHCQSSAFMAGHAWLRRPVESLLDPPFGALFRQMSHWRAEDDADAYQAELEAFRRIEEPSVVLTSQFFSLSRFPAKIVEDIGFGRGAAILAVRSQVSLASSLIRELVRVGDVGFEQAREIALAYDMDWPSIAARWSAIDGFLPTRLLAVSRKGDLQRDLLSALDVPADAEGWEAVPSANVGLPSSVVCYLYARKGQIPPSDFPRIVQFFLNHPALRSLPDGELLDEDARRLLISRHKDGNAVLSASSPLLADALRHPSAKPEEPAGAEIGSRLDRLYALAEKAAAAEDDRAMEPAPPVVPR